MMNLIAIPVKGPATVATVGFSDLYFQELQPIGPTDELSLEQMIAHASEERKVGQVRNTNTRRDDNHSDS